MIVGRYRKQPNEALKLTLDYAERVTGSSSLDPVVAVESSDPALSAAGVVGTDRPVVQMLASGGVDGITYTATVRVTVQPSKMVWEDEVHFVCSEIV